MTIEYLIKNLCDQVQIQTVSVPINNRTTDFIYIYIKWNMTSEQITQLIYLNNLNINQDLWDPGNVLLAAS
jgi:hypothetical protein